MTRLGLCAFTCYRPEPTEDFAPVAPTVALKSKICDVGVARRRTGSVGPILSPGLVVVVACVRNVAATVPEIPPNSAAAADLALHNCDDLCASYQ